MATAIAPTEPTAAPAIAADLEHVLVGGDLSKLTAEQRVTYYRALCQSLGLNPLTRPFDYITLSGKLTLYAKKDATEQLRASKGVSLRIVGREMVDDCYVVTAEATDARGRVDSATGAVACANLKGEAKANALMKAETKAKRRVTLSICGLGLLDESEVSSIPGAQVVNFNPNPTPPIGRAEAVDRATGEVSEPEHFFDGMESPLRLTEAETADVIAMATKAKMARFDDNGEPYYPLLYGAYDVSDIAHIPAVKLAEVKDRIRNYASKKGIAL